MITLQKGQHLVDTLNDNEIMTISQKQAKKAKYVFGSATVKYKQVKWKVEGNSTVYTDYVIIVK